MKVELVRYSQDVDINDPKKALSFLVLRTDAGKEFRVRVGDETIRDLVLQLDQGEKPPQAMEVDGDQENGTEEDPYYGDEPPQVESPPVATSEDGVPSL